jgi:pullulanase
MFRKYMVDSITYWQTEYHLDGFRFDLMGLHDTDTMQAIEQAVHAIDPQAILYGEGWTGGTSTLRANRQAIQANIREVHASEGAIGAVAVFNDAIRDGLKGSVFDSKAAGYISGDASALNANKVLFGVTGGEHSTGANFKVDDALLINYMSSHDNRTLWDILKNANPDAEDDALYVQNQLGAAIVLLSRGTPFMLAGEEMLRTKNGDENSYKSSDEVNNIDWERLTMHSPAWEMSKYYSYLIELRRENDWIRNGEVSGEIGVDNSLIITYTMDGTVKGMAFANPTDHELAFRLPDGTWTQILGATDTVTGEITVPAKTLYLFRAGE